jgi:glycosyltransferase involved in cell wall biosynthesis
MNEPFFSICMPVYNGEPTVHRAIDSVLGQTFTDWRLTIIDNQSTDSTWELITREYGAHPQVRLHRNTRNLGLRGNLNRCLELAQGKWLGILAADDAYRVHALETIHSELHQATDMLLWTHGQFAHCLGLRPNAVTVFNDRVEFSAGALAELLYKKGNLFGVLSSYFLNLQKVREAGATFIDGDMLVDLRFYIRLLRPFPDLRAIYWPDLLSYVNTDENTASHRLAQSGRADLDLIRHLGDLAALGWKRSVLSYQLLRLAKCAFNARGLPLKSERHSAIRASAAALLANLLHPTFPKFHEL